MLSPIVAPLPPPASTKPRPRTYTLTSPSGMIDASPSNSRSYFQPVGTGSQRRQPQHARSRSQGDAVNAAASAGADKGKRRAVFCDLVLDDIELDEDGRFVFPTGPAANFLDSLGTPVHLPDPGPSQPTAIRPTTPGKPRKVDYDKVRQSLHELWVTEESYLRKMSSLLKDYALPLRSFSRRRETAIIPGFEATRLFSNIEELVPVSEAFERDLKEIVGELQRDRTRLPDGFGEMILRHVERMTPYKKWLADVSGVEMIRSNLDKNNSGFREFVERTQVYSRESAQTTGGFKEFLAEPFQRISRYRLMLDPIIAHLPLDDENVEPLQIATGILSDICSMRIDEATKRAAVFWSLKEAIDGFPDTLIGGNREYLGSIDADEVIEVADSRPTTLRTTLFLFTDTVVITKRPTGDKLGKAHAGLDDLDRLVGLYQTAHLTSAQANLVGTPKKLRKGVLGFRGAVPLNEVVAVDLGSSSSTGAPEFGLMFDHPPMDQSERWCGRPARRFVVASTYAPDVRAPEKDVWLNKLAETVLLQKLRSGARRAVRGKRSWDGEGVTDSTEVYWAVWDRRTWEGLKGPQKGKLALQLVDEASSPSRIGSRDGRPVVSAYVTFVGPDRCRFEVKSSSVNTADMISIDRITAAVAELGMSYGLYSFPHLRPLSLADRLSRPRSALLGVFEALSGGGLKRGNSMTSKTSSVATTTVATPALSASASPAFGGAFSPSRSTPTSPRHQQQSAMSQSMRVRLSKKSAPDLLNSVSRRLASGTEPEEDPYGGMAVDGDESRDEDALGSIGPAASRNRRAAGRRSLSLPPPPQARYDSPTPSPGRAEETSYVDDHEASFLPTADEPAQSEPSPMLDAVEPLWPRPQEMEAPTTSPMAYRPQVGSTRRRVMGPRDMRSPGSQAGDPSYAYSSPSNLPFAREHSPSPVRRPHTSNTSTITYASSAGRSDAAVVEDREESPAGSSAKRTRTPVEMSPRPTPAKKVASLGGIEAPPRHPSTLSKQLLFTDAPGVRKASNSSITGEKRVPSGRMHIRSRRVTSGSTIRGPPSSPPKEPEQPDVFSSPVGLGRVTRKAVPELGAEDVHMNEADEASPLERLRKHVDYLRLKLAREVANKENGRIASPTSLSRSPHTRNVFAKSLADAPSLSSPAAAFSPSAAFAAFGSEPRPRPSATASSEHNIDLTVLSRWTRTLGELVDACEVALREAEEAKPATPEPVPDESSALEVAMLEEERDLIAAELEALKKDAKALIELEASTRQSLELSTHENVQLRAAYDEICQEAGALLEDFNLELEKVTFAAQAEPSATGEYVELTSRLREAVSARYQAEHDLRQYRREVRAELEEKERWGALLRQHGLLPAA
ncbi:hypothetical protein JCM8097_000848 [Rhodosporidiobolus ruineniae]